MSHDNKFVIHVFNYIILTLLNTKIISSEYKYTIGYKKYLNSKYVGFHLRSVAEYINISNYIAGNLP